MARLVTPLAVAAIAALAWAPAAQACGAYGALKYQKLAAVAIGADRTAAEKAIDRLRAGGPAAMRGLQVAFARELAAMRANTPTKTDAERARRAAVIDVMERVGRQKDAHRSGLYWFTDANAAQAEASRTGRPILSLRLLGNLDEELSCANSRFFRTALYANQRLGRLLSDRFVLHWQSVRPVPKITIDFGDGRSMQCTITGNSIHYVLDAKGNLVDALPGLYGPKAFERELSRILPIATQSKRLKDTDRAEYLRAVHAARRDALVSAWQADLRLLGVRANAKPLKLADPPNGRPVRLERAVNAQLLSKGKAVVEMPVMRRILPDVATLEQQTDDATWAKIATLRPADGKLDDASRRMMRTKFPLADRAMVVAVTKAKVEDPMLRMIRRFEHSLAVDTVKNQYKLHRTLHDWLAAADAPTDVDALNKRVYAELFLTPDQDRWLGLSDPNVYTALPDGGRVVNALRR